MRILVSFTIFLKNCIFKNLERKRYSTIGLLFNYLHKICLHWITYYLKICLTVHFDFYKQILFLGIIGSQNLRPATVCLKENSKHIFLFLQLFI